MLLTPKLIGPSEVLKGIFPAAANDKVNIIC